MKPRLSPTRLANSIQVTLLIAGVLMVSWLATPAMRSQVPAAATAGDGISALLAQLKQQQDELVANQTKIETQTAALKEELRLAKIYSARGGGAGRR